MENLILFLAASVGATLIVTLSTIFEPLRNMLNLSSEQREEGIATGAEKGTRKERIKMFVKELFHCPLCFGFWMGVVNYIAIYKDFDLVNMFLYGCASSAVCILCYSVLRKQP